MNGNHEFIIVKIESIVPPIDNSNANYMLHIKNSKQMSWIKQCTMEELTQFRNYITKYVPSVNNIPFPARKKMSYIPFIGKSYSEHNWDILLENKFILDNFFESICKDLNVYKLNGFAEFFAVSNTKVEESFKGL